MAKISLIFVHEQLNDHSGESVFFIILVILGGEVKYL